VNILSVDLASRRYRDNGIAILRGSREHARVELVAAESLGLVGQPEARLFAERLCDLATKVGADLILLDGPQGWRASDSTVEHMRLCERETRTPGKTGVPFDVKPASWTRMAVFSIEVFQKLHDLGWPRFDRDWLGGRCAIETFPTHGWRALQLPTLPAKSKRITSLQDWTTSLSVVCELEWSRAPNHDELQAVVGGIAGLALGYLGLSGCEVAGRAPFLEGGLWREGFILSARRSLTRHAADSGACV